MAEVAFTSVGKVYAGGTRAVDDLSFTIGEGEFMVVVGPSGCGKTTALRMVAGLEEISEGEITIDGRAINDLDPRKRDVAMVFQNYALYPHMSVFDNIAFPLRSRRLPKPEIRSRVEQAASSLGLVELLDRKPRTLSGGQRQRVAMGRAIVRSPQVFLMDEPLSNLDAKLRGQMRSEISRLQAQLGITTMYVTHDQVEAMTMGTRIAVMRKGILQQVGPPQKLYDEPANLFVATFVGSPTMNLFRAAVVRDPDGLAFVVGEHRWRVPELGPGILAALAGHAGGDVALGIRSEDVHAVGRDERWAVARGEVQLIESLGADKLVHVEVSGDPVVTPETVEVAADIDPSALQALQFEEREKKVPLVMRLASGTTLAGGVGSRVEVALDLGKAHVFDLASGLAIR